MKFVMCSVLDLVGQQYGRPFFAVSSGSAIRGFTDEVNTVSESTLYKHPDDFQLFEVGSFEDSTGAIVVLDVPSMLISGAACAVR